MSDSAAEIEWCDGRDCGARHHDRSDADRRDHACDECAAYTPGIVTWDGGRCLACVMQAVADRLGDVDDPDDEPIGGSTVHLVAEAGADWIATPDTRADGGQRGIDRIGAGVESWEDYVRAASADYDDVQIWLEERRQIDGWDIARVGSSRR